MPASWNSYGSGEAILLAIVLLMVAGGFGLAGKRLRAPLAIARPGGVAAGFMIVIWLLSIYTVVVVTVVYGLQVKQTYPGFAGSPRARRHVRRCGGDVLRDFLPYAAVGLEDYAGQRHRWDRRRADDFRVSVRSDRHGEDQSADPASSDAVSAAFLPAVVPGRVLNGFTADVAAVYASDCVCLLRSGRDVCSIRRVGCVRVCVSRGTAAACAECDFKDFVLCSGDHAVCLEGGRGRRRSWSVLIGLQSVAARCGPMQPGLNSEDQDICIKIRPLI